jgi:hypothetical protein
MQVQEISERLGLDRFRNRRWVIQGCSASTGDGLYEGMDWLARSANTRRWRICLGEATAASRLDWSDMAYPDVAEPYAIYDGRIYSCLFVCFSVPWWRDVLSEAREDRAISEVKV